jgi:hypothetical protein
MQMTTDFNILSVMRFQYNKFIFACVDEACYN